MSDGDLSGNGRLEAYRVEVPRACHRLEADEASLSRRLDGFFYIPNFISNDEEAYLLKKLEESPKTRWTSLQNRRLQHWGGHLAGNTLIRDDLPEFMTRWPALVERIKQTGAFSNSKHGMPNHCLVNEYLPGQGIDAHADGDAYHPVVATISLGSHTLLDIYRWAAEIEEGAESTEGFKTVADINAHTTSSRVRAREQSPCFSILQESRSLLLTCGSAYDEFLHGIAERMYDEHSHLSKVVNQIQDAELSACVSRAVKSSTGALARSERISLTFREVERVSKSLTHIFAKGGKRS